MSLIVTGHAIATASTGRHTCEAASAVQFQVQLTFQCVVD
jgi:hypothetical protein